jgi:hypothetical protein
MLIHFEIRGETSWESLGSGESTGNVDRLQEAIDDLRSLHGGELPPGDYRWILAYGDDARWQEFDLGPVEVPVSPIEDDRVAESRQQRPGGRGYQPADPPA